jgi:NAD(P)H dehydrogenase (quinone)
MIKPKILVTAAAGKTGMAATLQLLNLDFPVRAMVQRHDERSQRLCAAGAEIVVGSLEDIGNLRSALRGVKRAYFCPPLTPGAVRRAALFAAAAQEARLEAVVVLSQWLSDPLHPAAHSREKWLSSKLFGWAPGIGIITINPGFFADNYFAALEPMAHFGIMAMPLGDGLNAPPSNEDIARVVVGAITNPEPHIGKSYRPTGPRLMPPEEIAVAVGKALGRPVRYQNAPMRLFLKAARSLGLTDFVIEELSWFLLDYQRGSFGIGAPTSAVIEVGQSQPEEFELIARRYVAATSFTHRTPRSSVVAIRNLAKILVSATPDPKVIARRLELPTIENAVLAADSADWQSLHQ